MSNETDTSMTPEELEAFRRWKAQNPTAAPGVYWVEIDAAKKQGNPEYDAAILLRVLPDGQTLRVEIKHTGWIQELWDYIPREGRRPAAGNGCYNLRSRARDAYYASPERAKDRALIESKIPDAAKADARVWDGTPPKAAKAAGKKKAAPKGMTPAA